MLYITTMQFQHRTFEIKNNVLLDEKHNTVFMNSFHCHEFVGGDDDFFWITQLLVKLV